MFLKELRFSFQNAKFVVVDEIELLKKNEGCIGKRLLNCDTTRNDR